MNTQGISGLGTPTRQTAAPPLKAETNEPATPRDHIDVQVYNITGIEDHAYKALRHLAEQRAAKGEPVTHLTVTSESMTTQQAKHMEEAVGVRVVLERPEPRPPVRHEKIFIGSPGNEPARQSSFEHGIMHQKGLTCDGEYLVADARNFQTTPSDEGAVLVHSRVLVNYFNEVWNLGQGK